MEPGPCIPLRPSGGFKGCSAASHGPPFRDHPCKAPAQGGGLRHFPETKNNRNTVTLRAEPQQERLPAPPAPHPAPSRTHDATSVAGLGLKSKTPQSVAEHKLISN